MDVDAPRGLLRAFAELEDPRMDRTKRHRLPDILIIAICATICGADDWTKMELFGRCKGKWFRTFLDLPNGIPSHDTFRRVFTLLDPEAFEQCFMAWIAELTEASGGRLIAVDGKTLRGSLDRANAKAAVHMVSAWCNANRMVLGQVATEDKSWFAERDKWKGLRSLIRVRCERTVDGEPSCEEHYYLSSLPADDPEKLLSDVRGHGSVENRLHWSLDISFADDERRTRTGHGAENASRLARIALNLLKAEKTLNASIKSKRLLCGWDHDYLLKVLLGPPKNNLDA